MNQLKSHSLPVLNETRATVLSYMRSLFVQEKGDCDFEVTESPENIGIEHASLEDYDGK